jgi:hypothetical protein
MIEIATGMIVTMSETVMGVTTGIDIGTGEIAIVAIGSVIDSSLVTGKFRRVPGKL